MNCQLRDITLTARDGRVSHLEQIYIRGSHIRFFIVPDMLRNAPMFRRGQNPSARTEVVEERGPPRGRGGFGGSGFRGGSGGFRGGSGFGGPGFGGPPRGPGGPPRGPGGVSADSSLVA